MQATADSAEFETRGAVARDPSSPMDWLHTAASRFDRIIESARDRDQLLVELAGDLLRQSTAGMVIQVFSGPVAQMGECDACVLGTRYKQVPGNLQQWATTLALKSIISGRLCFDSVTDAGEQQLHMVAMPVRRGDSTNEALAAMFTSGSEDALREATQLQSTIQAVERWDIQQDNLRHRDMAKDSAALNELIARIETAESPAVCGQQIANRMRQALFSIESSGQPRIDEIDVFVALADAGGQTKLAAVSNADTLPEDGQLTECVESAFGECVSRNAATFWPATDSDRHALLCHQRLAATSLHSHLISLPLQDATGKLRGAMLVFANFQLSQRSRGFCLASGQPLGSILGLMERAQQNRLQRFLVGAKESLRTRKARLALQCAGLLLVVALVPLPYRISTDCEIQPSTRRFVCSPFDSQLKECLVEPGDLVSANEIVARLDEREIRMELAETQADFHRANKKRDGFVAAHESGEARLAELETDKLRARNELLNHRTGNLELRSPIAGIVISGDLKNAEGMPVETGQSLLEIAPLEDLYVEVLVPEDDVRYVQPGMSVRVSLKAFPFESWRGTVERVHPAAEIRNENNIFVAKVQFDAATNPAAGKLRPGMQGSAKISSVWRPLGWNLLHQPVAKCLRWVGW